MGNVSCVVRNAGPAKVGDGADPFREARCATLLTGLLQHWEPREVSSARGLGKVYKVPGPVDAV